MGDWQKARTIPLKQQTRRKLPMSIPSDCPAPPSDWRNWHIIIPARLESTRLPRKLLQDLGGAPVIVRVAERLAPLKDLGAEVVVAADAEPILEVCRQAGIAAVATRVDHQTGSDRVFEASQLTAQQRPFILNVQGDEPFIDLSVLTAAKERFEAEPHWDMISAYHPSSSLEDFRSRHCVKVVLSASDTALYFSRAPIPSSKTAWTEADFPGFNQHLGIYGFTRDALARYCQLPKSTLETCESLEQLRALEQGMVIGMVKSMHPAIGIDNQEDLDAARKAYASHNREL